MSWLFKTTVISREMIINVVFQIYSPDNEMTRKWSKNRKMIKTRTSKAIDFVLSLWKLLWTFIVQGKGLNNKVPRITVLCIFLLNWQQVKGWFCLNFFLNNNLILFPLKTSSRINEWWSSDVRGKDEECTFINLNKHRIQICLNS